MLPDQVHGKRTIHGQTMTSELVLSDHEPKTLLIWHACSTKKPVTPASSAPPNSAQRLPALVYRHTLSRPVLTPAR